MSIFAFILLTIVIPISTFVSPLLLSFLSFFLSFLLLLSFLASLRQFWAFVFTFCSSLFSPLVYRFYIVHIVYCFSDAKNDGVFSLLSLLHTYNCEYFDLFKYNNCM